MLFSSSVRGSEHALRGSRIEFMHLHKKALCALAVSQLICLACGLWIQDRFLFAAAKWHDRQQVEWSWDASQPDEVTSEALTQSMPGTRMLALAWIGGLQMVAAYLVLTRVGMETSDTQKESEIRLLRRERDLVRTRNALIFGLAKLAEYRDWETGRHLERIALYCNRLSERLRQDPRYRDEISPLFLRTISISAVLHDIGKVGIEDSILRKPGRLDDDERRRMQRHTVIGAECIRQIGLRLGNSNFLQMAREIALYHHERWDGTGYPTGLASEDIPLAARIVAIADVYDALSSDRVYKDALPHDECIQIIQEEAGEHFDPALVEIFLEMEDDFREIASRFADGGKASETEEPESAEQPLDEADEQLISAVLDFGENESEATVGVS